MRSLARKFKQIEAENPNFSSYICFAEAIKGRNFSPKIIKQYFNQLVDPDDYDPEEKRAILQYLYQLSKSKKDAEEGMI